jgi:hypothetical protein
VFGAISASFRTLGPRFGCISPSLSCIGSGVRFVRLSVRPFQELG